MRESTILAHAEARANLTTENDTPTEDDFVQAVREVREMLADGATYDIDHGWIWP